MRWPGSGSFRLYGALFAAGMLLVLGAGARRASGAAGACIVQGRVEFERLRVDENGLHIPPRGAPRILRPARQVVVEVVDSLSRAVLAEGETGEDGTYSVTVPAGVPMNPRGLAYVRVLAENRRAMVVHRRLLTLYSVAGKQRRIQAGVNPFPPIEITDQGRRSGPFAILDTIHRAGLLLGGIAFSLPQVTVHWDTQSADGAFARGEEAKIFLAGSRQTESDEFDESVVAHEFGHIVSERLSRDDSPGGEHALGEAVDPRLAWSEGWATYFSTELLQTPSYIDTRGPNGGQVFQFRLDRKQFGAEAPSTRSEFTVGSTLWHATNAGAVTLAQDFPQMVAALSNMTSKLSPTYLMDFWDRMRSPTLPGTLVDNYLQFWNFVYRSDRSPTTADPFPTPIRCHNARNGTIDSTMLRHNRDSSAAFYEFRQARNPRDRIRIELSDQGGTAPHELDLYLWNSQGRLVRRINSNRGAPSLKVIDEELTLGTYTIEVRSYRRSLTGTSFNRGSFTLTRSHPLRDSVILDVGTLDPEQTPPGFPVRYRGNSSALALSSGLAPYVTGTAATPSADSRGYLWTPLLGIAGAQFAEPSTTTGVNSAGDLCGTRTLVLPLGTTSEAFFRASAGNLVPIKHYHEPEDAAPPISVANGMTVDGRVVGRSSSSRFDIFLNYHRRVFGFATGPGGANPRLLGTLQIETEEDVPFAFRGTSEGMAIGENGTVVGRSTKQFYSSVAVTWGAGEHPSELQHLSPPMGGPQGRNPESAALAINSQGIIAGFSENHAGPVAVVWISGVLQRLSESQTHRSVARGINSSQVVVGSGEYLPAVPIVRALMWRRDGLGPWQETELQERICPDEGWLLTVAYGINDEGWVVGTGERDGRTRGFALRLRPDGSVGGNAPVRTGRRAR